MQYNTTTEANTMDIADLYEVSYEHEYYTDSDSELYETLTMAKARARQLAAQGKRRIAISGPGIELDGEDL